MFRDATIELFNSLLKHSTLHAEWPSVGQRDEYQPVITRWRRRFDVGRRLLIFVLWGGPARRGGPGAGVGLVVRHAVLFCLHQIVRHVACSAIQRRST